MPLDVSGFIRRSKNTLAKVRHVFLVRFATSWMVGKRGNPLPDVNRANTSFLSTNARLTAIVGASTAAPSRRKPMLEFKLTVKITMKQLIKFGRILVVLLLMV